ncbi:MAG: polysaccharide biosynthesis protein PslG [Actinomycetota bacterium]|nr:polysaccharide biosynthesis protein PslG [Actinomycetota bacterium]
MRRLSRIFGLIVAPAIVLASLVLITVGTSQAPALAATSSVNAGFSPGSPILWESDAALAKDLDAMASTGAKWIRIDVDWASAEPTAGSYNWAPTDRVINGAAARGMSVIGLIAYTPAWARPASTNTHYPPTDNANFGRFATAAVNRYASKGVHTWELWNEPNLGSFWQPAANAAGYTALLKAGYAAVKAADPSSLVLSAGMAPATDSGTSISPVSFIKGIYAAGGKGSFDAVAIHPYSYPAQPMDPNTSSWNTFYRMPLVHDVMTANGDGAKQVWATEYGAPTGTSTVAVSEATQALMVANAYAAIQQWSWAGPLLWYAMRDSGTLGTDPEQNFGLLRNDFTAKSALAAFNTAMGAGTAPPAPTTTTVAPVTTTVAPTTTTVAPTTTTVAPTTTTTVAPTTTTTIAAAPTAPTTTTLLRLPRLKKRH